MGKTIHKHARSNSCAVVPCFLGHGIGDFFHGPPDIYHGLNNYPGLIKPGMVFTIEPCISEGDRRVRTLEDGWTAVTLVSLMESRLILQRLGIAGQQQNCSGRAHCRDHRERGRDSDSIEIQ